MGYGSDVLTGGTASASSYLAAWGDVAARAVDDNASTTWTSAATGYPQWLQYDLGSGISRVAAQYTVRNYTGTYYPKAWTFQGSNDGSNWTTLDTQSGQTFTSGQQRAYNSFSNSTGFRYYRLSISSGNYSLAVQVAEWEVMETDAVDVVGRVTQVVSGAYGTDTAQSAVATQASLAFYGTDTAQSAVVTRAGLGFYARRRMAPVFDVICLAIHWDSGTGYYSDRHARHPDRVYEGRVVEWSTFEREAEPHALPSCSEIGVALANSDRAITDRLAAESPLRRRATIHVGPESGSWSTAYFRIFEGVVSDVSVRSDGTVGFRLMPSLSERLPDRMPTQIDPEDWPDLPADPGATYMPVVYGRASGVTAPFVDAAGYRYLAACHPCSVTAVYLDGSIEQPEPVGHYHLATETVGGMECTIIDFSVDCSGFTVTCDIEGVPDDAGQTLTNPVLILADYCERFIGVGFQTSADYAAAASDASSRGWSCSMLLAGETHEEVVGRICREFGIDLHQTWRGQLRIGLWNSTRARFLAANRAVLDAHRYTLADSTSWEFPRQMVSTVQYRFGWNGEAEIWSGSGVYDDPETLARLGGAGYGRVEQMDLRYCADASSAADVVRRRQFWEGRRSSVFTMTCPAEEVMADLDIGDLVRVGGLWKPSVDGSETELCRVVAMSLDMVSRRVAIRLLGTGFSGSRRLGDRADPLDPWSELQEDARWNTWHLADRASRRFSDGDPAHSFRYS